MTMVRTSGNQVLSHHNEVSRCSVNTSRTGDNSESTTPDWGAALLATLNDAIEHLQVLIFEDSWDTIRAVTESDEDALRASVARYEEELGRLFGFLRATGALESPVAWSSLKVDFRRAVLEIGTEISLRTALESGLYTAERVPLGNHDIFLEWSAALQRFLLDRASSSESQPAGNAPEDERLLWAYQTLADLEDHDAFQAGFIEWITTRSPGRSDAGETIEFQKRLHSLPRFDLVLNTSLRWLAASADS